MNERRSAAFKSLVAKLGYFATKTRPDIVMAVNHLRSQADRATTKSARDLDKILEYLNGHQDMAILYRRGGNIDVRCWCDASDNCHTNAAGHMGIILSLGESPVTPIYVTSKKLKLTARSSTEAELMAAHTAYPLVIWLDGLINELGLKTGGTPKLYQDNLSTILASTEGWKPFSKLAHVNRRFFCIKDQQDLGSFETEHCGTKKMKCDSLTKPGTIKRYQEERDEYMTRKETFSKSKIEADKERRN